MGWFSSSTRADEIRSGTAVPNRSERQVCWAARDAYFACLNAHDIVDAQRDADKAARACPAQTADFERDCAAAWVKYFKQWRVADIQKQRRIQKLREEGAQELPADAITSGTETPAGASKSAVSKQQIQEMLDQKRR
ncbi:cytochrome oxidase c subunit VIb-domain-containing protein [Stachybotrys elegans]|uniref:Cytochrome oxidase c subunit VIb-domain-containing protein n=1 Tax=Stachybotrys elegans TaxID=80388 RepID=A0A8K0SW72_9HYPO|nr:cytochrome oxidase c subunit VIb-domain-containing protein [Stachybotrys elegans]